MEGDQYQQHQQHQHQHRNRYGEVDEADGGGGEYANIGDLTLCRGHEMVINPHSLMRARSSHSVAGKVASNSGWNFLPADRNTMGHNTLNRGMATHNGLTTVSNSIPGTLMNSSNNQHVLTAVPGDPSGRLVMTLLPQGHEHMTTHGTNSSHSARYGHAGHTSSNSRQTLTSLRPSWLRGDARRGSVSGVRGKDCTTPQCSWRLLAIALLLTCGLLAAALAYFTVSSIGVSSLDPNCIVVEDAKVTSAEDKLHNIKEPPQRTASNPSLRAGEGSLRQEQSSSLSTSSTDSAQKNGRSDSPYGVAPSRSSSRSTSTAAAELEPNGQWTTLDIDAANLWVAYVKITTNSALRILLQLPRGSPFAVYGRRNVAPSITRHDFSHFLHEGESRFRRQLKSAVNGNATVQRFRFNTSLVEPVEPGRWFLALYNDDDVAQQVAVSLTLTTEVTTPCPDDCNGRGHCVSGKCICRDGFAGTDCSTSVCPVLCSGRGTYGGGRCHCDPGWAGPECDLPFTEFDLPFITCSIPCGIHGKCLNGRCQCDADYTGASCETSLFTCQVDCGANGRCVNNSCVCSNGWTGSRCHLVSTTCDHRCTQHGQCVNGTCICSRGWNGRYCTLDGCPSNCGNSRGVCLHNAEANFHCQCTPGWTGSDCSIMMEMECNDDKDNDGDGLTDCADSDCCSNPSCVDHLMCLASADPSDIASRNPIAFDGASFYQRVKFLVEDNAVQSYAHKDEYVDKRVSVLRGRVLSQQGLGVVGVRVSVERHPRFGFTLTRNGGWFDILVNGGGAVTLQFQRNPYRPEMRTVWTAWNRIVVLDDVTLRLGDDGAVSSLVRHLNIADKAVRKTDANRECLVPELEMMRLDWVLTQDSQFQASDGRRTMIFADKQVLQEVVSLPGLPDYRLIYRSDNSLNYFSLLTLTLTPSNIPTQLAYVHVRVIIEGTITEVTLEAEANLTYTFAWDRHNVYRQKIYGDAEAYVRVGYEAAGCAQRTVYQTLIATVNGFSPNISSVGEFNIDVHHQLIVSQKMLFRGDGGVLRLAGGKLLRTLNAVLGSGGPRSLVCAECLASSPPSPAAYAKILNPITMATGGDGSLYVGDYNLIRRVTPQGRVYTVLQLPSGQVSQSYYLAVSPIDGSLYVSDCERKQILRVNQLSHEQLMKSATGSKSASDGVLESNFQVVVGSGEPCLPADPDMCGDGKTALQARLVFPKGIAISADRILYFADGTAIRSVDTDGIIRTIVGRPANPVFGLQPAPCNMAVKPDQIQPLWPTQLSLNPVDNTIHWMDNNVVLKLSAAGYVQVVAGLPQHCAALASSANVSAVGSISTFSLSPDGSLFFIEKANVNTSRIVEMDRRGRTRIVGCVKAAGGQCSMPTSISSLALSADGIIYMADKHLLQVLALDYASPQQDAQTGEYSISWPSSGELLIFNRYGQHVTTKDLTSNKIKTTFSYTKNGAGGKLMAIIDAKGNKIDFVRDAQQKVSAIETSAAVKSHLTLSRASGALTHINSTGGRFTLFDYHPVSRLMVGRTQSDGLTSVYHYDAYGRLVQAVLPDGERFTLQPQGDRPAQIHAALERLNPMSITIAGPEFLSDNSVSSYDVLNNGSHLLQWGIGNQYQFEEISDSQWRESFQVAVVKDNRVNNTVVDTLWTSIPVNGRSRDKTVKVNGVKILVTEVEQSGSRQFYDGDRQLVMSLSCDAQGHLKEFRLPPGFHGIRYTYDGNGRLQTWVWGQRQEVYSYDSRGLLTETRSPDASAGSRTISYGPYNLVSRITLGSGRSFSYDYDESGGLKSMGLPSGGGSHSYTVQPSMGYYKLMYMPPGSSSGWHAYVEHYDSDGRRLFVMFPGESGRIVYRYNQSRLAEEVSGDRRVHYSDTSSGSLISVVDRDFQSQTERIANDNVIFEDKTEYGAKTGLASFRFVYAYDSLMKISSVKGRIGGQVLAESSFSYQPKSGALEQFGQFKMSRLRLNETSYFDGTAIFTRVLNGYMDAAQSSLTLHNVEVFRMELHYDGEGRINQTRTYTRYVGLKSYVNIKNYTYDADGQLVSVEAPESWRFTYDPHGNLAKLTYRGNSIPMQHNAFDRLVKFGEGAYQYDDAGNVIQNAREEKFQWSASGLLVRALKKGVFDVRYFYDHQRRLIGRRDQHGNVTQFFYANVDRPLQVTHIFSPRDLRLSTLTYDDADHLMYVQILRHRYYVATDQCGTPAVIFSQHGELVRELVRSPYGHVVYDSNPYLYMPVDWCGGIADPATGQVHVNGDRIYDPLIGQWLNPQWSRATRLDQKQPELVHLYRLPRNDPINLHLHHLSHESTYHQWLHQLGYQLPSVAAQRTNRYSLFEPVAQFRPESPSWAPASAVVRQPAVLTSTRLLQLNHKRRSLHHFADFASECRIHSDVDTKEVPFSMTWSSFGRGILVSRSSDDRAVVSWTSGADAVVRDVLSNVFNGSRWLNITLAAHAQDTFHFFKRDVNKVTDDMATLRRLGPSVNLTLHETLDTGSKEIKISSAHGNLVLIYGTDRLSETQLLWRRSMKVALRRAWHREQMLARRGGINSWTLTSSEMDQLARDGHLPAYRPELQQTLLSYPLLADDPTAMTFRKRNTNS